MTWSGQSVASTVVLSTVQPRTRIYGSPNSASDDASHFYFLLPSAKVGCHPVPFWLGAAAMTLIFFFLGFLASRLLLCWPLAMSISLGLRMTQSGSLPPFEYTSDAIAGAVTVQHPDLGAGHAEAAIHRRLGRRGSGLAGRAPSASEKVRWRPRLPRETLLICEAIPFLKSGSNSC